MPTDGRTGICFTGVRRLPLFAGILLFLAGTGGCVTGKVLYLPGSLSRPAAQPVQKAGGGPAVAVLDFRWEGSPSSEVGRDYDQVRQIVWKGNPGRTVADLIAAALEEKGIPTIRAAGEADVPAGIPGKVWGRVDEFRVNVKRVGTVKVEAESVVSLTVFGSGPATPSGWSSVVGSTYSKTDPFFITPEGAMQAVNGAANTVAEEAVRRLVETGVVAVPHEPDKGGAERK